MRDLREIMTELAASGLSPGQQALVMELVLAAGNAGNTSAKDSAAEKRRAYDRDRKRKPEPINSTGIPPEKTESLAEQHPPEFHRNSTGIPPEPSAHVRDNPSRLSSSASSSDDRGILDDWPAGDFNAHCKALVLLAGPGLGDPAKDPGLTTTIAEIDRWRLMGCSWSRDVVPTIRARTMKPRQNPIRAWNVLTQDVLTAKARREAVPEAPNVVHLQATGPPGNAAAAAREEGRRKVLAKYEAEA